MCDNCMESERREQDWWLIYLYTAAHVVWDETEARNCEIVFFDTGSDDVPVELRSGGSTRLLKNDLDIDDSSLLLVVCHGEGFVSKLRDLCKTRRSAMERILNDVTKEVGGREDVRAESESDVDVFKPLVLIGYPHGRRCHVTLGEVLGGEDRRDEQDGDGACDHVCRYRVDSCPGSSGSIAVDVDRMLFGGQSFHSHSGRGGREALGAGWPLWVDFV